MRELEKSVLVFLETHELSDSRYQYLVPVSLLHERESVTLEAVPIGSEPRIFVQRTDLPEPQPVFVKYYHDDSDDDGFNPDAYDITRISGFFIDPGSGEAVHVFSCQNDSPVPPHVEPGSTFFQSSSEGNSSSLTPIDIFNKENRMPCRFIDLSLKA